VAQEHSELDGIETGTGLWLLLLRIGMGRLLFNPHPMVVEPVGYCPSCQV